MLVPQKDRLKSDYRYGFQGQEKDDELKDGEGNSLNYTFRMHDPRIGRFFAVDPLTSKYPYYSPYHFSSNTPIIAIELEGLETGYLGGGQSKVEQASFDLKKKNAVKMQQAQVSGTLVKLGFNHYLPKKFIDFYTGLTGGTVTLTDKETIDVHASPVSIKSGTQAKTYENEIENFNKEFSSIKNGGSKYIKLNVLNKANTQGTLGQFTVIFKGILSRSDDGENWSFKGTMQFYDIWDFDTKKAGDRLSGSESATGLGNTLLIGKGFKIYSPIYNVTDSSDRNIIDWFEGKDDSSVDTKSTAGEAALKTKEYYNSVKDLIFDD